MSEKIKVKDLINIGVFTALYFVVFFATGMLGYVPVLLLLLPVICPITTGVVFMLFLTKVNKFGMVTIMGIIIGLLMVITGHHWSVMVFATAFPLLADIVLKMGNYQKWGNICAGFVIFSEWFLGMTFPIFFMRDNFFAQTAEGYGVTYAETLKSITPPWVFFAMIALVVVGAVIGAFIGKKTLKKHFERAGIA